MMRRGTLRLTTIGLSFLCALPPATARAQRVASADELIAGIRAEHDVPALGALVVTSEGVVARGIDGTRARGGSTGLGPRARWHIGSCTKAMTATLAARLVERGDLSWETTIGEALAGEDIEIHEGYQSVTIEQLLRHRGGLPGTLVDRPVWGAVRLGKAEGRFQRWKIARDVLADPPAQAPGEELVYSNAGYVVAGLAMEAVAGQSYRALMQREVFAPLGMDSAGWGPPSGPDDPRGHRKGAGVKPNRYADNPAGLSPAGRAHMTLDDWAAFVRVHLRGARGEETGYLKPATFERVHTPPDGDAYAMGWIRVPRDWATGEVLVHAGSNTMWLAKVFIAPTIDAAVLAATNEAGAHAERVIKVVIESMIREHVLERARAQDP